MDSNIFEAADYIFTKKNLKEDYDLNDNNDWTIQLDIYGERHNRSDVALVNEYTEMEDSDNTLYLVEHSENFEKMGECIVASEMCEESIKDFLEKLRYGSEYIFHKKMFENKLNNLIAVDNRLSLNVLGKVEYETYLNLLRNSNISDNMCTYDILLERIAECRYIFIQNKDRLQSSLFMRYSEISAILDSNFVQLVSIHPCLVNILTLDIAGPCMSEICQKIAKIDEVIRNLLYDILKDLETIGSLFVDSNIIDIINMNTQSNDPKYSKIVLFAGNSHAIRIAKYYGAKCTRNPPKLLELQSQKLSLPIPQNESQQINESCLNVEQNEKNSLNNSKGGKLCRSKILGGKKRSKILDGKKRSKILGGKKRSKILGGKKRSKILGGKKNK